MLGIDRRALGVLWTAFLFALVLIVIYEAGRTLIVFGVAVIFAHLLAPVVNFIERRFPPRVPRVWSLLIVYVALLGVIVAISIPLVSRISHEAEVFVAKLPDFLHRDPLENLPIPRALEPIRPEVTSFLEQRLNDIGQRIGPMLSEIGTHIITGLPALLGIILIPILAFFFLKDGAEIRDMIVDSFELNRRELVDNIFNDIHLLLIQYIRALVLLSLATFTFYSLFLGLTGAPFPVLLAGAAAVFEFIPVVGPLVAAIAIILVAAANGYAHMLILILFFILYRMFQDYVLNPYVMSAGVELHPLLVLFGVLAGDQLLGVPGMFFSVPAMATLRLIINRLRRRSKRI
ncbi:MAG TPA: AI-2E family transporter [Bryobacteraceae bacterium]|nr:AI-2E family transporter [Bryobacteraceae bacterium]